MAKKKRREENLLLMKQQACYPVLSVRGYLHGRDKFQFVAHCERLELRASEMINEVVSYYNKHHPIEPKR